MKNMTHFTGSGLSPPAAGARQPSRSVRTGGPGDRPTPNPQVCYLHPACMLHVVLVVLVSIFNILLVKRIQMMIMNIAIIITVALLKFVL